MSRQKHTRSKQTKERRRASLTRSPTKSAHPTSPSFCHFTLGVLPFLTAVNFPIDHASVFPPNVAEQTLESCRRFVLRRPTGQPPLPPGVGSKSRSQPRDGEAVDGGCDDALSLRGSIARRNASRGGLPPYAEEICGASGVTFGRPLTGKPHMPRRFPQFVTLVFSFVFMHHTRCLFVFFSKM